MVTCCLALIFHDLSCVLSQDNFAIRIGNKHSFAYIYQVNAKYSIAKETILNKKAVNFS